MVFSAKNTVRLERLESRMAPAGSNVLASQTAPLLQSDSSSGQMASSFAGVLPTVSADGRFTVFTSAAANLATGQVDKNASTDVFVFDKSTNAIELISRVAGSIATAGDGQSFDASISADGRYVSFTSTSKNLITGSVLPPGLGGFYSSQIFRFDRVTNECRLASPRFDNAQGLSSDVCQYPLISGNGQSVIFSSYSVDLVAGFPTSSGQTRSQWRHLYLYDGATGAVSLIDHVHGKASTPVNIDATTSYNHHISHDGRFVTFGSKAPNLLETTWISQGDVYRYDRATGLNELVTRTSNVAPFGGDGQSSPTSISADGRWIAFSSRATNLVPDSNNGGQWQALVCDVNAGTYYLASRSTTSGLVGGNAQSLGGRISADGRFVMVRSHATDLISGFVDGNGATNNDHFLFDRITGEMQLISAKAGTTHHGGNGFNYEVQMSSDGVHFVLATMSTDILIGFTDGNGPSGYDLFSWNRLEETRQLLSHRDGMALTGGNGNNQYFRLSADGGSISWSSSSTDLAAGVLDLNNLEDVWIKELANMGGTTFLASRRNNEPSFSPGGSTQSHAVSADGRWVAYSSTASNIVPGQVDQPNTRDIFLLDRWTNTTTLVSRAAGTTNVTGAPDTNGSADSASLAISADGRYIAFCSWATNLVPGFVDTNGPPPPGTGLMYGADVYLFDRVTGLNTLVSHQHDATNVGGNLASGGVQPLSVNVSISDDGRFVTYASAATNLVAGFVDNNTSVNGKDDIYLFDRTTGVNTLVSHAIGQNLAGANQHCQQARLSGDGNFIVFWGRSTNLAPATFGSRTIFLYDRNLGTITVASHGVDGPSTPANADSNGPTINFDGRYILFRSAATNLVAGQVDTNNLDDIFLYDRLTAQTTLVSHAAAGPNIAGNGLSDIDAVGFGSPALSADGRFVAYHSHATDLVTGITDANSVTDPVLGTDVFLFDRQTGANTLVSRAMSGTATANYRSDYPAISGDGRYVAFESDASDLTPGQDTTIVNDTQVYLFDRLTNTVRLASHDYADANKVGNARIMRGVKLSYNGSVVTFAADATNLVPGDFNVFTDIIAHVTPPPRVTSVQINDGSAQRSVIRSMTITLDDYVFVDSGPLSVVSSQGQAVGSVQWAAEYKNNTTVMIVTFGGAGTEFGSLADGKYTLTVFGNRVSGIGFLDGNGDGVGGDDYTFQFHRLFGDGNGDGMVSAVDFNAFRLAYSGSGLTFDFNNDGVVTALDFMQFRMRYGMVV